MSAPIQEVTVYTDRAMITRSIELNLPAGDHTIVIENLPYGANDASFRGSVRGNGAMLMGLNHRVVNLFEIPQADMAQLDREIYQLEKYDKQRILDRKEVFEKQKKLLNAISIRAAEDMTKQLDKGGMDVAQWRDAFNFVGTAMMGVNDSISASERNLTEIGRKLSKLKNDRRAMGGQMALQNKVVEFDVRLLKAGNIAVELNYIMTGAGWKPMYDARLNEQSEKVDFTCYGEITQQTGEDWDGVDLVLSTSQPSQGTGPGQLRNWVLSLLKPVMDVDQLLEMEGGAISKPNVNLYLRGGRMGESKYYVDGVSYGSKEELIRMVNSAYSTSFAVTRKMTIPSGNEAVRAPLGSYALDRVLDNICRPQNRQGVYRLASITNQDEAPLLPGKVSIFAGSDYLGTVPFQPNPDK